MYRLKRTLCILFLLLSVSEARPWELQAVQGEYTGTFVPHLIQGLDSWIASMLSQSPVPLVGAGAALAYIGYAGTVLLTSETPIPDRSARSSNSTSSDILTNIASNLVKEALGKSQSAVAFRKAGARALHHGATVLRRGLNAFSRIVGALYSTIVSSQTALGVDCVAERLCRIGQMTGTRFPLLGVLLRSLDSVDLDVYSRAIIDGTTVGDCKAMYPNCSQ